MKSKWQNLTDGLIGKKEYFLIDTTVYSFFTVINRYIDKYVRGDVLDAGAGRLTLKFLLTKKANKYYAMDKYIARQNLDMVGDLNAVPFKEKAFDVITCLQVIEHTKDPGDVIKNLAASLKDGGVLILSAPHISYLHGEPEDYYRYTKYGLRYMAEKNGLKVLEISAAGSIFGFLFTPISDFLLSYTYGIQILFNLVFFINALFVRLICKLDECFFKNCIMPTNYIMAVKKTG